MLRPDPGECFKTWLRILLSRSDPENSFVENRDLLDVSCFRRNVSNAISTGNMRFQYGRRNDGNVKPPEPGPSTLKKDWGETWVYLP